MMLCNILFNNTSLVSKTKNYVYYTIASQNNRSFFAFGFAQKIALFNKLFRHNSCAFFFLLKI